MTTTTTEDELAVRNLIARFAKATDVGTMDEYMACIAEDATMDINDGLMIRTGSQEIREAMVASRSAGWFGPGTNTMHVLGPSRVTVDGDTATAWTTFQFFRDTTDTKELVALGRHVETFARTNGEWRLVRRVTRAG